MTTEQKSEKHSQTENTPVYASWSTKSLTGEAPLPADLYVCLNHRVVFFRKKGQKLLEKELLQLSSKNIHFLFVRYEERTTFSQWIQTYPPATQRDHQIRTRMESKLMRKPLDVFQAFDPKWRQDDRLTASKTLMTEVLQEEEAMKAMDYLLHLDPSEIPRRINTCILTSFAFACLKEDPQLTTLALSAPSSWKGWILNELSKENSSSDGSGFLTSDDPTSFPWLDHLNDLCLNFDLSLDEGEGHLRDRCLHYIDKNPDQALLDLSPLGKPWMALLTQWFHKN